MCPKCARNVHGDVNPQRIDRNERRCSNRLMKCNPGHPPRISSKTRLFIGTSARVDLRGSFEQYFDSPRKDAAALTCRRGICKRDTR